jgi:iron complex outermembrane receptor protein
MTRRSPLLRGASTLVLAIALAASFSRASQAQSDPTAAAPAAKPGAQPQPQLALADPSQGLEEIVVSAEKRKENVQRVPIAITAITGASITSADQILKTNDITHFVPNASSAITEGPERPRWFIRGIGTNSTNANTVNPVGVYYDDVYIANVYNQGLPLFDLDHVEVLRGPQGTLWGKNSNGGAINFISKAPSFDPDGYAKLGYGSYDHLQLQGAYGGAIIDDKLAGRISFYHDDDPGWQKNIYDGRALGGGSDDAGRGQLLVKLTDELTADFDLHFRKYDGTVRPSAYYPDRLNANRAPGYPTAAGVTQTPYGEVDIADPGIEQLDEKGGFARINWDAGAFTVTSITGYENNHRLQTAGIFAPNPPTAAPLDLGYSVADYWQGSEELRIASPTDQDFTWLGGLYGFVEHLDASAETAFFQILPAGSSSAYGSAPAYSRAPYSEDWDSYAVFGNVGYKITDRFKVSAGARFTTEDNSIAARYYDLLGGTLSPKGTSVLLAGAALPGLNTGNYYLTSGNLTYRGGDSRTFRPWTYDFSPEYQVTDQLNVYFRYAHGVLPGGYTFTAFQTVPGTNTSATQISRLNQETLESYELGAKSRWFDNHLTANLAIFNYDYTNALTNVTVPVPGVAGVTTVLFENAGAAYSRGIELQLDAVPLEGLKIGGNLGLLDTKYTQDTTGHAGIVGAQIPRSPHVTVTAYINYDEPLNWGGDLVWALDGDWRSKQYFYGTVSQQQTNYDPYLAQRAYGVANAHLTWITRDDGKLSFELSILNLTDTTYAEHGLGPAYGSADRRLGEPRSAFFSANLKF